MSTNVLPLTVATERKAEFFGVEIYRPDGPRKWVRIELVNEEDGTRVRYWPVGSRDPRDVAAEHGSGCYRVAWLTGGERKARICSDPPFEVSGDTPPATPPLSAAAAPAAPSYAPVPAAMRPVAAATSLLPPGTDAASPLGQFAVIHAMSMANTAALLEQMRIGQQQQTKQQQDFFAAMMAMQQAGFTQVRTIETEASRRIAEAQRPNDQSAAVVQALEALRADLAARAEEEDDDEDDETPAAPAPVDPGQAERIIGAFGGVLDGLQKLGLGPVLQKVIAHKMGIGDVSGGAADNVAPIG